MTGRPAEERASFHRRFQLDTSCGGTPLFDLLGLKGLLAGAAQGTAGLDSFTIIHALLTVFAWVMVAVMLNRALAQMNELTSEAAAESRSESEKGGQAATIG